MGCNLLVKIYLGKNPVCIFLALHYLYLKRKSLEQLESSQQNLQDNKIPLYIYLYLLVKHYLPHKTCQQYKPKQPTCYYYRRRECKLQRGNSYFGSKS
jgi:hypothetical protein